uniref:Uncharacterized protein n=1 Tax=Romanomermis culicivorax TaxID=13658 RepID=A0A915HUR2_ROMCU
MLPNRKATQISTVIKMVNIELLLQKFSVEKLLKSTFKRNPLPAGKSTRKSFNKNVLLNKMTVSPPAAQTAPSNSTGSQSLIVVRILIIRRSQFIIVGR